MLKLQGVAYLEGRFKSRFYDKPASGEKALIPKIVYGIIVRT